MSKTNTTTTVSKIVLDRRVLSIFDILFGILLHFITSIDKKHVRLIVRSFFLSSLLSRLSPCIIQQRAGVPEIDYSESVDGIDHVLSSAKSYNS